MTGDDLQLIAMAAAAATPQYRFIEDPGHGWLEVPVSELGALGIAERITGYSYVSRDGTQAYLEEDCDLGVFIEAKGWRNWRAHVRVEYQDPTFVRGLPSYGK